MSKLKNLNLRTSDKIVIGLVLVLTLVFVALSIMQRSGLTPVHGALMLYVPVIDALLAVGWGLYALVRRIRRDMLRRVAIGLLVTVVFLVVMLGFSYLGIVANVTIPQKYSTLTSPGGTHKLVLLRAWDHDESHYETRKAARLAADPESSEEDVAADYGFVYKAYPEALGGLFYRYDADVEGEAYIGYESAASLKMEWPDEDTAHFYVADPGPADGGEFTVRFDSAPASEAEGDAEGQ